MHYEIGNLPWDLFKVSLGFLFGVGWVHGNRHVTTKSFHQGMLNMLRSRNERINVLLRASGRSEDTDLVEYVDLECVDEIELGSTSPPRSSMPIVPPTKRPIPGNNVRVYEEHQAINFSRREPAKLECSPPQIRRITRKDDRGSSDQ